MLPEPAGCGGFRQRKLIEIRREMAARNQCKSFWFECSFACGQREVGEGDRVVASDDEEQRRRRHPRNPNARLVHTRGARRAKGDGFFPQTRGYRFDGAAARRAIAPRSSSLNARSNAGTAPGDTRRRPCSLPTDCRDFCDDATRATISGADDDRVSAGVARAPQTEAGRIDFGTRFEVGDRAAPVGDLRPGDQRRCVARRRSSQICDGRGPARRSPPQRTRARRARGRAP